MNEYLEQQRTRDSHEDASERFRASEPVEAEVARAEHAFDCHPDPRPIRRETRATARRHPGAREHFKRAVLQRDQGCCVHSNPAGGCDEGWQAHHVVYQQHLRITRPRELWEPRVGMSVCGRAHRRHHSGHEQIPYELIPPVVAEYLCALGFGVWLERHYPATGATESDAQP